MKKKYSIAFTITLMLLASAFTCLVFAVANGNGYLVRKFGNANDNAGRDMAELLNLIEDIYIGEYDVQDLSTGAMRAVVDALDDRWSYYMTPEEYEEYTNSINNQFTGIGVSVIVDETTGGMMVTSTYKGAPAETAGIVAGDIIIGVDGESIKGLSLADMRDMLVRPIGETVELAVLRTGDITVVIPVVYDLVFSDPISYEMLEGNVGYIRIENFEGSSADGFIAAVAALLEQRAEAFVFDVRSNGGGLVSEMTKILDHLLPEGEIFISIDKNGREEITWSDPQMLDMPAAVLINKYSYSAAEYFAATLKEYGYAKIVGEQTTGKSRSQRTERLHNGGALHISTGQYLTKNRVALFDAGGLAPDYQLTLTDDELLMFLSGNLDRDKDPQLQLALSVLTFNTP